MSGPWMKYQGGGQVVPNRPGSEYQGPQAAAEFQGKVLQNQRLPVQTQGDIIANRTAAATQGDAIAKMAADRAAAQATAQERMAQAQQAVRNNNFARAHNNLPQDKWNELNAALQSVRALNPTIARLRDSYNANFRGKGIQSIAEMLPSKLRPANGVFDATAMSLIADLAKAKGLTSQQFNTPAEQRMFFEPLVPKSSDTDEEIASKIDALQRMANRGIANYAGQMGLKVQGIPAAQYSGGQQGNRSINFNDLP